MKKIFHILVFFYLIFGIFGIANAISYKMIWENDNLIFNIEEIVGFENNNIKIPKYLANEQKIEWNFWIKEIWPVKMNIKIECYTSKICSLKGKWQNSTIWEIDFSGGNFDNNKKIFGGKINTNIWQLSLDKISLGQDWELEKYSFVAGKLKIKLDKDFGKENIVVTINNKNYSWTWNTVNITDITKIWKYKAKVEVNWERKNFDITIIPGEIYKIRMEQTWSRFAGWSKIIKFYPEDKHWNSIKSGKIWIRFQSQASSNKTGIDIAESSSIVTSPQNIINNYKTFDVNSDGYVQVEIKSATISEDEILLSDLRFNGIKWDFKINENDKKIKFQNPIQITTDNEEIYPNQEYTLKINLEKIENIENINNVKIIAEYATIDSQNVFEINWNNSKKYKYKNTDSKRKSIWKELYFGKNTWEKDIISKLNIKENEEKIKIEINIFAEYISNNKKIITKIQTINKEIIIIKAEKPNSIRNLTSENNKAKIWNTTRKNINLLKRNINNFDNKNYIISDKNIELNNNLNKQSYITIGADIIINENISNKDWETPIAIIATNSNEKGGKILISENVTNLEWVVLMADKIENKNDDKKDKQLYIFGSVFADNGCMEEKDDCLPNLRKNYTGSIDKSANWEIAKKYKYSKVILQYNPKLISNPPIWLAETIN